MDEDKFLQQVRTHYESDVNLETHIEELFARSGLLDGECTPEKLAPMDQFHAGGLYATEELSELLTIRSSTKVLDVGSGLGGASRYLAYRFGCHVTGIDLSPRYCRAAQWISQIMKLDDRVTFCNGNALNIPSPDGVFDVVWTQHAVMNIEDRSGLYKEIARVLKPNGYLALYDVVRVTSDPIVFPVPWASTSQFSHLLTAKDTLKLLNAEGFLSLIWEDVSDRAVEWFKTRRPERLSEHGPKVDLSILLGDGFGLMAGNYRHNLETGACGVLQAVLQKSASDKDDRYQLGRCR